MIDTADTADTVEPDGATLHALIALVRQHTGIAMNEHKRVLLHARLRPRMRALGLARYGDYIERVRSGGAEVQAFINLVTTNDTAFFRTPALWHYLEHDYLPQWYAAHGPGATLQAWSAAAASGEEAYSLAMLCLEFQQRTPGFRFAIRATDISTHALHSASAGRYSGRSVTRFMEVRPNLMRKYLLPAEIGYEVAPALRQCLRLGEHNLLGPAPAGARFDLVLLRNVLIYFDEPHQIQVLAGIRAALAPQARLLLGEQESITRLATPFAFEQAHVYRLAEELP